MPIYEYRCQKCSHRFEELVRSGDTPECPSCKGKRLERLVSAFAVGGSTAAVAETPLCGSCGMQPGSCGYQ